MPQGRLLAHYARIADAPDAVSRLRKFVLDLAVLGRFSSRANWPRAATQLGNVATLQNGYAFKSEWFAKQGTRLVRNANVGHGSLRWEDVVHLSNDRVREFDRFNLEAGDIVLSLDRPFIVTGTKVARIVASDLPCLLLQRVGRFQFDQQGLSPNFLYLWLTSPNFTQQIDPGRSNGVPHISSKQVEAAEIFVPPLVEQHRIVAKVDELMALCDRLETARAEREAKRDRLAVASLARLNAPDPKTFHDDARFALNVLPALATRPDQIKQLRQTILNLAVRGKLTDRQPSDLPAAELLARASAEIADYAAENGIRVAVPEAITEAEIPCSAPVGWKWARLCELFKVITDGDHQPPPRADAGIAFLTIGNITTGRVDFSECRLVPEEYYRALAPYRVPLKGDVLYTVVGATLGRPALVDTDRPFCVQRHIAIMKPSAAMDLRFLSYLLGSPSIYDQACASTTGTAQPTIPLRPLRSFLVAVPPLAEQDRIVAKVDELMAVCDQLEASITASDDQCRRLLDALLRDALSPVLALAA